MQYESVQILYKWINWAAMIIFPLACLVCAKEGLEAHIKGDSYAEAFGKIKNKLFVAVVGTIGAAFVGTVKGYF